MVSALGWTPGDEIDVRVIRAGVTIGTAVLVARNRVYRRLHAAEVRDENRDGCLPSIKTVTHRQVEAK
jgi:hypothetical protein